MVYSCSGLPTTSATLKGVGAGDGAEELGEGLATVCRIVEAIAEVADSTAIMPTAWVPKT